MKKLIALILIAFFMGCNDDVIKEDFPEDTLKSGKMVTKNIILQNLLGTFSYEANPENSEFPLLAITKGTGNATHMGRINFQHTYLCDAYGMPVIYVEGFVKAANGDKFFTMATNSWLDEESGVQYSEYDIINGTGRFEDCTGELTIGVEIDWAAFTFTAEGYGTISY